MTAGLCGLYCQHVWFARNIPLNGKFLSCANILIIVPLLAIDA